jgi:hypothetical protein
MANEDQICAQHNCEFDRLSPLLVTHRAVKPMCQFVRTRDSFYQHLTSKIVSGTQILKTLTLKVTVHIIT